MAKQEKPKAYRLDASKYYVFGSESRVFKPWSTTSSGKKRDIFYLLAFPMFLAWAAFYYLSDREVVFMKPVPGKTSETLEPVFEVVELK